MKANVKAGRRKKRIREPTVIGWREIVSLPELGLLRIRAKIDTGARTSALHADNIEPYERDSAHWVAFHPCHPGMTEVGICHWPVHDRRSIRNTSGVPEERIIIRTRIHLAGHRFLVELSLADRSDMAFPIIIGRSAIRRHGLLVDGARSWLTAPEKGESR